MGNLHIQLSKFGESNNAQYHDGGDLQSKQSAINETLKKNCWLMVMRRFAFYAFSECYFFSEVTVLDEGFFFNDNLAPTCSEKGEGVFSEFYKIIKIK